MDTKLTIVTWGQVTILIHNVQVESYSLSSNIADDQQTPFGEQVIIRGTGLIYIDDSFATMRTALTTGTTRCQSVSCIGPTSPGKIFEQLKSADDRGGPFLRLETTEIVGSRTALVRFEITANNSFVGEQTAVSHTWTGRMALDAAGQTTYTINGAIRVARSTSGSMQLVAENDDFDGRAAYADLFRRAIIPDVIGPGWRRESQDFAMDVTGTMLTYTIVDKRCAHDLPDGVRVGDMECTYERTAENQNVAIVNFSCDLEGDTSLKGITGTTGNRRLVEAAVQLSKTRINVSYQRMQIQRLRVTERNILSGFAIRFELQALALPADSDTSTGIVPLAYMIGRDFAVTRTTRRAIDAYGPLVPVDGTAKAYGMLPHWLDNTISGMNIATSSDMPWATVFEITGANEYGSVSVAVVSGASGTSQMNSLFSGRFQDSQRQPSNDLNGYQTLVGHNTSTSKANYDSGIIRLSPMYVSAQDVMLQTRKPCVYVSERAEIARMNQAPAKVVRPLPTYAYLTDDNWHVAYGKFDAQGNRMFTGVYERTFAMYDPGTAGSGFVTQTTPGGGQLRAWGAPNVTIIPTIAPIGTSDSQSIASSVFANVTEAAAQYRVPTETFVT